MTNIPVRVQVILTLIQFKRRVDFLIRSQVENNPWYYNHPDLCSRRIRIQSLLRHYNEAFAHHPTFRHWTQNDFNQCVFRNIQILNEVLMYLRHVYNLFASQLYRIFHINNRTPVTPFMYFRQTIYESVNILKKSMQIKMKFKKKNKVFFSTQSWENVEIILKIQFNILR